MDIRIPHALGLFCQAVNAIGGRALLVGGCVRDAVMGGKPKDFDVEVYHLSLQDVESCIKATCDNGVVNAVGVSFGVLKARFNGQEVDISLPRLDNKSGEGHKGFVVNMRSDLTVEQAAERRDFTMNAMAYDPLTGELIDPFNGKEHIAFGCLIPTSDKFMEDPLRILRGMQFVARFDMGRVFSATAAYYGFRMSAEYDSLPVERVWMEWEKWATKGVRPSAGLEFLDHVGWLELYPEIDKLRFIEQDPSWHPEGNAYVHTLHVCDAMARLCESNSITGEDRCVLMFAALCHDFGKAVTTEKIDGRWRAPGHAKASVPMAERFLKNIGCYPRIISRVLPLVEEHMAHIGLEITPRTVRRLAHRLGDATIRELGFVVHADMAGRPPLPAEQNENMAAIVAFAEKENVAEEKVRPLVMGRDLIELGWKAGPDMGRTLKALYERQLDGEFSTKEEGIALL